MNETPQSTATTGSRVAPGVVLAATPIGNYADASPRLTAALAQAEVIAAEDTRRVHRLAQGLGVTLAGRVVSYHEHNEASRTADLLARARAGETVLAVTDAGMPSVCDPGFRLVAAAIEEHVPVTCLPGPSAVLTALALSGLPTDRFCFEGFLPRKDGERSRQLAALADEPRTMIFFEAPHRTRVALTAMAEALGEERRAALCRELTKTHEEVLRGTLAELRDWAAGEVRGEICIVVAGAAPRAADLPSLVDEVLARVGAGERLKDAAGEVALAAGVSRKALYDAALAARKA